MSLNIVLQIVMTILYLPATVLAGTVAPLTVKLSLSTTTCEQGQDLVARCEVTTLVDRPYMVIWLKKYPPSSSRHGYVTADDAVNEVEIGSNHHVNDDFRHTGRYTAAYQLINGKYKVLFTLTITDVRSEDSGYIGCRIPRDSSDDRVQAFQPFTVRVPVQSVLWTSVAVKGPPISTVYSEGQMVSFIEDDRIEMSCDINGSYPQPTVRIYIGNATDMTSYFSVTSHLKRGPGPMGLQPLYYRVMATNRSLNIGYDYRGLPLRCVATLPGPELQEATEGSINIHITKYKPKFLCDRRLEVRFEDEPFNITCIVRARPLTEHMLFSWNNTIDTALKELEALHNEDDDNHIRPSGHDDVSKNRIRTAASASALVDLNEEQHIPTRNSSAKYHMRTEVLNETDTLMVFTINPASASHVGWYTFIAENELGRVKHVIELEQEPLPIRQSNGYRTEITLSLVLPCISVSLSSFIHH